MASYSSRNAKRRYNSSGVVNGSLARKLDGRELERQLDRSGRMDFDELYEPQRESAIERNARRRAQAKASARVVTRPSNMTLLACGCVAALLVVLLGCYVRINTISRSIVSMKTEIKALEVEQVSLLTQYEQAFDLSAVKEAALAAGMSLPSDSQVFYITLPGEDQATAHQPSGRSWDNFLSWPKN